ncbi:hypothetical protein [Acidianus ambivalens]|uniref:TIGR00267 family protein n=1 Tax=Acidianus ambivalens TaxID=2283 RepID=A0A650CSL9_ACIAM|nr:hypothetical protein [Acidianus ambivalens]MQL55089.1 hypothetical protein [Acidianus ambivalens]QGR20642.1 hypothetical protein D1866_00370 [Acidianus ambivalens]
MFEGIIDGLKYALKYERSILRRYLILGSFDGLLLTLGIIMSAIVEHIKVKDTEIAILSGLTAVSISSMWNSLIVEAKEKREEYKELERQMMKSLKGTIYDYGTKATIVLSAFAHGISPFLGLIVLYSYITTRNVVMVLSASSFVLFMLGLSYEGEIKDKIESGILILVAGLFTALLTYLLGS